ncbi:MAG TPA: urease accessory UreF family protein [Stellaceae bacterium]|nr:urease accessory UreF family protein [Stellaceae bacterium]
MPGMRMNRAASDQVARARAPAPLPAAAGRGRDPRQREAEGPALSAQAAPECASPTKGALYRLLAWLSPAFPVGAYGYSHGLEAAAADGRVAGRAALESWVEAILVFGGGRLDANILRSAHRAAAAEDLAALLEANRRGAAFRATAEMALEALAPGEAFLVQLRAAWPMPVIDRWAAALAGEPIAYAAAFGAAAGAAGIALDDALLGFLQAMAANLISAALRLGIIGQTDGQRILAALEPAIAAAAASALLRGDDEFGAAAFAVELASMAHETQYSRLFRS